MYTISGCHTHTSMYSQTLELSDWLAPLASILTGLKKSILRGLFGSNWRARLARAVGEILD